MKSKIYNFHIWLNLNCNDNLKCYITNLLKESNFKILNFCEYYFEPIGYTALWLLGESHCAIHTFPEENKVYIELSSCSKQKYNIFKLKILKNNKGGLK